MTDTLILTQKLLAERIELPKSIRCTEIIRSDEISVIKADATSIGNIRYQATVIWDLRSDDANLLHFHISEATELFPPQKLITVRAIDGKVHEFSVTDIVLARSSGRYMTIVTDSDQEIVANMTFARLFDLCDSGLLRVHRSFAVNPQYIAEISSSSVSLKNSQSLPLSRSFSAKVKAEVKRMRYVRTNILSSASV